MIDLVQGRSHKIIVRNTYKQQVKFESNGSNDSIYDTGNEETIELNEHAHPLFIYSNF